MVFCILPVQADYWAGISENGQYQVTYTNNGDGSSYHTGCGSRAWWFNRQDWEMVRRYQAMLMEISVGTDTGVTQNLILDGPSGWAEVIAKDANEQRSACGSRILPMDMW